MPDPRYVTERITTEEYRRRVASNAPKSPLTRIGKSIAMPPNYSEDELCRACCQLLEQEGYLQPKAIRKRDKVLCEALDAKGWRDKAILAMFLEAGYKLYFSTQQRRKSKQTEGMPDLWVQGIGWVELKTPSGKMREEQQVVHALGQSVIVRHPDELAKLLEAL
jgi:hypothetical protein